MPPRSACGDGRIRTYSFRRTSCRRVSTPLHPYIPTHSRGVGYASALSQGMTAARSRVYFARQWPSCRRSPRLPSKGTRTICNRLYDNAVPGISLRALFLCLLRCRFGRLGRLLRLSDVDTEALAKCLEVAVGNVVAVACLIP